MTICKFNNYAPSGDVETKYPICILPINVFYEKVYFFMWYWTVLVAGVTSIHMIVRLVTILSVTFRKYQATNHVRDHYRAHAYFVVSRCGFGDWLILLRLLENLPELLMREVLREIRMEILGQKLPALPNKVQEDKKAQNGQNEPEQKSELPPLLPPRNEEVEVVQQRIYEKVLA